MSLRIVFALSVLMLGGLCTQASAQRSAYDYPYCARYPGRNGAMSCYYDTIAQCMATMSGIGGSCVQSPYYRGPAKPDRRKYR